MDEKGLIRKQLLKSMFWTLCLFSAIMVMADIIIFSLIKVTTYKSIDEELFQNVAQIEEGPRRNKPELSIEQKLMASKLDPKKIFIVRDELGNVTNTESMGRFYTDYSADVYFNSNNIGEIYTFKMNDSYKYRGITAKVDDKDGVKYIQILTNIDSEEMGIRKLSGTLIFVTVLIITGYSYISYLLARKTLKPIIDSWRKQTEFVQNASHELRTPLTIIQAKQQLLLQEPNSKILDKSQDINLTILETKRLTKLINDLMVLAMADSNDLKLKKEKIGIDQIIQNIIIPYKEFAELQGKEFELDLQYGKEAELDKNKIEQLIVILLDNAIKYTKEGEKITLKTYGKDNKCVIEVIDNGFGISKESAKHIFERFYREDKARTRETGGTGIGLSLAYTIVKLHGGTIKAVQNEPKGTKMIIKI